MNKKLLIILLFAIAFFTGCKKVPEGTEISVSGNAKAVNIDGPIPNATIIIFECKSGFYGPIPSKIIDSTITDESGNYSLDFKATGDGVEYQISIRPPNNYISYLNSPVKLNSKKKNIINFDGDKLVFLKSHFIVNENSNPPLFIDATYGFSSYMYKIEGSPSDTTIFMYAFPNRSNIYQLYIYRADSPSVRRSGSETIQLEGFADTFEHTFQIDPSTFK